ncbi:ATP-binding protein [Aquabacterium lacunae]|nr:ATP-binding protein [Aquabacterium lacunae]
MTPPHTQSRLPPIDRSLRQAIRAEQVRMLLGHASVVTVLATGFACLLAYYAASHVPPEQVHLWLALKVLVTLPRIAHAEWFRRHKVAPDRRTLKMVTGLLLLDGLAWGLAGIMLIPLHDQQNATFISACLMGVASVATFTLHAHWVANLAYCVPMIVPAALHLMSRQDAFGYVGGSALLLFLSVLMLVSRRAHRNIGEMLWRRFLMDRVVADKEEALRQSERQHAIKSQFVATMSHELRTPLHGILGVTRLLLEDHPGPQSKDRLGLVLRSGEHLLSIINHILDFSRIDAGHLTIESQPFDLDALLEDVVNLTAINAQARQLTLKGHLQLPKPCWVLGDAPRVRQVILNLVGNAIKFTEKGGIDLRAFRHPESGLIVVQVRDTGVGIAPDDLRAIFDPYRQAGNAVGMAVGGTGLGLTISREISRAMGGDITCTSAVGQGSTFEFSAYLPPTESPQSNPNLRRTLNKPGLFNDAGHSEMPSGPLQGTILLAEDNDVNALIVQSQLEQLGLEVIHAHNGQQALSRLTDATQARPDLVLMDCQMPVMDGFEATRRLRQHEALNRLPRLPVVALTASAMAEDNARCLSAGMDAHLPKPFEDADLVRLLSSYLQRAQGAATT